MPKKRPTEVGANVVKKIDLGWYLSAKPPAWIGGCVPSKPPTQLVGGARRGSKALNSNESAPIRLLKAIVAAVRPIRHLVVLVYCACLISCIWLSASRAGFDTNRLWRWTSLFSGKPGRRRYRISKNIRIRRMRGAERALAWRAVLRAAESRLSPRKDRLVGGGDDGVAPLARSNIRPNPPPYMVGKSVFR